MVNVVVHPVVPNGHEPMLSYLSNPKKYLNLTYCALSAVTIKAMPKPMHIIA